MYERIISGRIDDDIKVHELESHFKNNYHVKFYGFESKESAMEFINIFPKYVNLKYSCFVNSGVHCVNFQIQNINNNTGEANEQGNQRVKKLIQVLEKL